MKNNENSSLDLPILGFDYGKLQWREDHPFSEQFNDVYYSLKPKNTNDGKEDAQEISGLEETQYVFIEGNYLAERLAQRQKNNLSNWQFTIAETGFGTGLNFFAVCLLLQEKIFASEALSQEILSWEKLFKEKSSRQALHFYSIEKYPLTPKDFRRVAKTYQTVWPNLSHIIDSFLPQYENLAPGIQTIRLIIKSCDVYLHLIIGDAHWALEKYPFYADAWFLDGFSPSKNPSMWKTELFNLVYQHSKKTTTLSTFSAAGAIRRRLKDCGFVVEKRKGYGPKRECIRATVDINAYTENLQRDYEKKANKPWLTNNKTTVQNSEGSKKTSVLVVGAGLSGSSCAQALALKGFEVDVWDAGLSQNASDNRNINNKTKQGFGNCPTHAIAYVRFYPNDTPLSEWCLQSYTGFIRYINQHHKQSFFHNLWQGNGLLQLYHRDDGKARRLALQKAKTLTSIASFNDGALNDVINGLSDITIGEKLEQARLSYDALHYHHAGSINTKILREQRLSHKNIRCFKKTAINIVKTTDDVNGDTAWLVKDENAQTHKYDKVILANGQHCKSLINAVEVDGENIFASLNQSQSQAFWPIKQVKGQETIVRFNQPHHITKVICGSHYLVPIDKYQIAIGAGFHRDSLDNVIDDDLHQLNISITKKDYAFLNLLWDESEIVGGFAGLRCYSPDYIPLIGELFDIKKYIELMKLPLAKDKNFHFNAEYQRTYQQEIKLKGLYICHAMGARGVTSSYLAAQIIAAEINNEPLAISSSVLEAIHPARFLNRALIRRQISEV